MGATEDSNNNSDVYPNSFFIHSYFLRPEIVLDLHILAHQIGDKQMYFQIICRNVLFMNIQLVKKNEWMNTEQELRSLCKCIEPQ